MNETNFGADTVREACFELATHLMWKQGRRTNTDVTEHINELTEMSDVLNEIAADLLELFDARGHDKYELMTRSIHYLNDAQALPPLKGNHPGFTMAL